MSDANNDDEDDKPTVVLDLNALKAQAKEQQEELEDIASDLEFSATPDGSPKPNKESKTVNKAPSGGPTNDTLSLDLNSDAEESLDLSSSRPTVLLFDYNSEFFAKNKDKFPEGFYYKVLTDLKSLNEELSEPGPKAVVFNYNASPKAANQLCAQIKSKFPESKTLIMAKNLSKEKAHAHGQTKSGANGYVSAPFKMEIFKNELLKILG